MTGAAGEGEGDMEDEEDEAATAIYSIKRISYSPKIYRQAKQDHFLFQSTLEVLQCPSCLRIIAKESFQRRWHRFRSPLEVIEFTFYHKIRLERRFRKSYQNLLHFEVSPKLLPVAGERLRKKIWGCISWSLRRMDYLMELK